MRVKLITWPSQIKPLFWARRLCVFLCMLYGWHVWFYGRKRTERINILPTSKKKIDEMQSIEWTWSHEETRFFSKEKMMWNVIKVSYTYSQTSFTRTHMANDERLIGIGPYKLCIGKHASLGNKLNANRRATATLTRHPNSPLLFKCTKKKQKK